MIAVLDSNRRLLADLLAEQLPQVGYEPPAAGYLAWLDCRELGLGDDPSAAFLERGRVALSPGRSSAPAARASRGSTSRPHLSWSPRPCDG